MRQTEDSQGPAVPARPSPFSPVGVFVALMTVAIAVGAAVLLTKDTPAPTPATNSSPTADFSLTNAEAIARFKELRSLRDQLYRQRDLSLLSEIYSSSSPLQASITAEINRLLRDNVRDRSTYKTLNLHVVTNHSNDRIVVSETINLSPVFVNADGRNVTSSDGHFRQKAQWTLVQESGQWVVAQSVITQSRKLNE